MQLRVLRHPVHSLKKKKKKKPRFWRRGFSELSQKMVGASSQITRNESIKNLREDGPDRWRLIMNKYLLITVDCSLFVVTRSDSPRMNTQLLCSQLYCHVEYRCVSSTGTVEPLRKLQYVVGSIWALPPSKTKHLHSLNIRRRNTGGKHSVPSSTIMSPSIYRCLSLIMR